MITPEEFEYKVTVENKKSIFGYMYGHQGINYSDGKVSGRFADKIVEIELEKCTKHPSGLIFRWGYPGPDYNFYDFKDYGKTWAFSEEEIEPNPYPIKEEKQ